MLIIGLAILGGLILAIVIAHGAWQVRKSAVKQVAPKQANDHASSTPSSTHVTHAAGPTEPRFDVGHGSNESEHLRERLDPSMESLDSGATPSTDDVPSMTVRDTMPLPMVDQVRKHLPRIDALIDAIATLRLEKPVSGDFVLQHQPSSRRAGGKPFLIEGLEVSTQQWEPITPGNTYQELQAGVQLANRLGALNEIEYSEFIQKIHEFADRIHAMPDFPDMLDVVNRGKELDQFACTYDAQLAMRLRARSSAWSVAYVQQQALEQGFIPGGVPGRLVLPSKQEHAPHMLTLQFDAQAALADQPNATAIRELILAFDVPQSLAEDKPFDHWHKSGMALAAALDASLFDDGGEPLHPDSLPAVGEALQGLYDALAQRDLAAGSPAARRLFS